MALLVAGAACLAFWSHQPDAFPRGADPQQAGVDTVRQPALAPGRAPQRAVHPVWIKIPALELSSSLVRLGLRPDGTVQVPTDPALAGWFRHGPAPGSIGSSVILGHVDSVDGPAVFYRLDSLTRGDMVRVALDTGATASFRVTSVVTYEHADFPARRVYGSHGRRELRLVTCGGAYVASAGGYQANVVVSARWERTTDPDRSGPGRARNAPTV